MFVKLLLIGAVVAVVAWAMRPRFDFRIIIDRKDVRFVGAVAQAQQANLRTFFRDDLSLTGRLEVRGRRGPNGRLQLVFRGPIDAASRQKIRNFLFHCL